ITTTFQGSEEYNNGEAVVANTTTVVSSPFTEGLLRCILSFTARQQLLLCSKIAKAEKRQFKDDAATFHVYNSLGHIDILFFSRVCSSIEYFYVNKILTVRPNLEGNSRLR